MGVAEGTGYIIGFDDEAVVKHRMRIAQFVLAFPKRPPIMVMLYATK
jgi:hypothetical protein